MGNTPAQFAELLRNSYWAQQNSLADLREDARQVAVALSGDEDVAEFARLVARAADLWRE